MDHPNVPAVVHFADLRSTIYAANSLRNFLEQYFHVGNRRRGSIALELLCSPAVNDDQAARVAKNAFTPRVSSMGASRNCSCDIRGRSLRRTEPVIGFIHPRRHVVDPAGHLLSALYATRSSGPASKHGAD